LIYSPPSERHTLRILHITPILGPANGGSAVIPLNLAREQARLGNDVIIATSNYNLNQAVFDSLNGVKIEVFERSKLLKSSYYTPKMKKWLVSNGNKFDIIHLHNFRSYQSIIVEKFAKDAGVPYLIQAHGSAKIVGGKNLPKRIFDVFWGKRIIEGSSASIAVSKLEINHYVDLGASPESIKIIPNALVTDHHPQYKKKGEFRAANGISVDAEVVLFVGRLNRIKGIDVLIRAFAHLHDDGRSVVLVIVGPDDGEEIRLRELVKSLELDDAVRFIGFMNDPIPAYIDANLLAYPSRYEIFGLVPFEALWYGTPVVVTSENGCGKIISEVGCGITIPSDDEVALSDSIHYLLDNPSEGEKMVCKGREYIEKNLTLENVVHQLDLVYMEVIDKYGKKRVIT
jgi:glycosyltransferase involved in cell wall biosynthesis